MHYTTSLEQGCQWGLRSEGADRLEVRKMGIERAGVKMYHNYLGVLIIEEGGIQMTHNMVVLGHILETALPWVGQVCP